MIKDNNFPIKYAILELKEEGGNISILIMKINFKW